MSDDVSEAQKQMMLDLLRSAGLVATDGESVTVSAGGDSVTFDA
jgi:hypothetical protein